MMSQRLRHGGLAGWSIRRPIGVTMLALAISVPGLIAVSYLGIDLLPRLIYPEIRVRVVDTGVPARIMEDEVTRQLEEQLAITEGAIAVQSSTAEGRSAVDLSFPYGTDINVALQDASARLDRAKRFLPETIDPPIIFKRDPSQIPVMELVVSSNARDPIALRSWVDYELSKWFINQPGVAAAEVGGGLLREIQIVLDQERLAAMGFDYEDLVNRLMAENRDETGGQLAMPHREMNTRVEGRVATVSGLRAIHIQDGAEGLVSPVRLSEVAQVLDSYEDEKLRIRLNGVPGVKLSIQKQPLANTVAVVDATRAQLRWLQDQNLIPSDITITPVGDQSVFIRHALRNAGLAALSGSLLAMTVIYLFLGTLKRTLIVSVAIPVAMLVTFVLMQMGGLTLNIMTLGGLALGVGILVDSTIVMLENIYRHQREGETGPDGAVQAAAEVNSPIVASASTNLAAVLPFLFIGGLVGLLFRELIFTISAAIVSSMIVALTVVPALAARVSVAPPSKLRRRVDAFTEALRLSYTRLTRQVMARAWVPFAVLLPALALAVVGLLAGKQSFLPTMDEGSIFITIVGDPGMQLDEMDDAVRKIEAVVMHQPEVQSVFTQSGGFVFGRSEYEAHNRSSLRVQLVPATQRSVTSDEWVRRVKQELDDLALAGFQTRMRVSGVRGVRLGHGDDDISLRVHGPDLDVLNVIGDEIVARLRGTQGLRNLEHSYEEYSEELLVEVDRERAGDIGVALQDIGRALQIALDGLVVSDYIEGDRRYDIRLRLHRRAVAAPTDLGAVVLAVRDGRIVRLADVATVRMVPEPASILRDRQQRAVEVSASLVAGEGLTRVMERIERRLRDLDLPSGYSLYDAGFAKTLKQGQRLGYLLLGLALFLVFVVMAVQYESLRNPIVILLSIPFAVIGVAAGLWLSAMPVSMPVWLGLIMLAGIVVNNAIVLVEQIEIERARGAIMEDAIVKAAGLRLRPILMTALTTVAGMTPLAVGFGDGSEMLQPLAVVIVWGLSFSTLVSLLLVPAVYRLLHRAR